MVIAVAGGWMPENTIPGFIKAVDCGADALEMDVVITKDKKVVVSHESWMSAEICLDQNGNEISAADEKKPEYLCDELRRGETI